MKKKWKIKKMGKFNSEHISSVNISGPRHIETKGKTKNIIINK